MTLKFTIVYILGVVAGATSVVAAMTPEMLTALGALIVAVITAVGAVIVNVLTARKVDTVKEVAEKTLAETQVVKGHVNSAAAAAAAEIKALRDELKQMQVSAAEKKEIAAVLAQAASSSAAKVPSAESGLVKIDQNTAAIKENTEGTRLEIKELKQSITPPKP